MASDIHNIHNVESISEIATELSRSTTVFSL